MKTTIKGTNTERNLLSAFAGESQARNRYSYFASVAKKEGYVQIAAIFEETANQEREQAKRFFKFPEGSDLEITCTFPAGKVSSTIDNLKAAAMGEYQEWSELYPGFANTARDEGFTEIANVFEAISIAEKQHEKRYNDLAKNIGTDMVFKKEVAVVWRCLNCGYLHEASEAPDLCPACAHTKSHFEILAENW